MISYVRQRACIFSSAALVAFVVVGSLFLWARTMPASTSPFHAVLPQPDMVFGRAYTSQEAGIDDNVESSLKHLVYMRGIEERNGVLFVTVHPVEYVDCRGLRSQNISVPVICEGEASFALREIGATSTYELATSAGPFFLNAGGFTGGARWRTMRLASVQALLRGETPQPSFHTEYYDATLHTNPLAPGVYPSLFFMETADGVVTKLVEKYRE